MISQSAEYALRAVLALARLPRGTTMTTQSMAAQSRVPAGYLAKVLQTLGRAGIVSSQRGLNGGFCLAVPPATLTLLSVVAAIEPSRRIVECPLGDVAHSPNLCPLHRRLDSAAADLEQMLRQTTVADVLRESAAASATCSHHPGKEGCARAGHDCERNRPIAG